MPDQLGTDILPLPVEADPDGAAIGGLVVQAAVNLSADADDGLQRGASCVTMRFVRLAEVADLFGIDAVQANQLACNAHRIAIDHNGNTGQRLG